MHLFEINKLKYDRCTRRTLIKTVDTKHYIVNVSNVYRKYNMAHQITKCDYHYKASVLIHTTMDGSRHYVLVRINKEHLDGSYETVYDAYYYVAERPDTITFADIKRLTVEKIFQKVCQHNRRTSEPDFQASFGYEWPKAYN